MGEYAQILAWLIIAVGAAMSLGTGAALARLRRTGTFPDQPVQGGSPPRVRSAVIRVIAGIFLVILGLGGLLLSAGGSH
jgi:hypothetical protein